MNAIKIIDIIHHRNKYATQQFVVIDRYPVFRYERKGIWLAAEDSGFFNFYYHQAPDKMFQAFAGREFDIPLADGEVIKANGQWWDGTPVDYNGLLTHTGIGTVERLSGCNVFSSGHIDSVIVNDWLTNNEPSNNYNKYRKGHPNIGKQVIDSPWEEKAA